MSLRKTMATQFDEVMDFYETASAYIDAAEETNRLAKSQMQKAKSSEPVQTAYTPAQWLNQRVPPMAKTLRGVLRTKQH